MHLDDEALRAWLDHELEPAQDAADHLAGCSDCRARLAAMQARVTRVSHLFDTLEPGPAEVSRSPQLALAQLKTRRTAAMQKDRLDMLKTIFSPRTRPVWVGLCAIVLFAVAFSFAPVRAWASDMLARFRVGKITVVQVDNTRLTELIGNSAMIKQIGQLVSDSMTVIKEPGKPKAVATAAEASQLAGFTVRLAANPASAPEITVQDGGAFQFVVNRQRAQMLLNEAGAKNIQLPAALDGANIKVSIPAGVSAAYGDCPKAEVDNPANSKGSPSRRFANCVMLIEIPSPTVDTPPNLDVQQLAELGLEFSGMAPDQARSFSQKVDWTSTLVIPVPRNGATYKELPVDGVTGYLIQRPADDVPQYVIVWIKNGIIHAVGGTGIDTAPALKIADSLK